MIRCNKLTTRFKDPWGMILFFNPSIWRIQSGTQLEGVKETWNDISSMIVSLPILSLKLENCKIIHVKTFLVESSSAHLKPAKSVLSLPGPGQEREDIVIVIQSTNFYQTSKKLIIKKLSM